MKLKLEAGRTHCGGQTQPSGPKPTHHQIPVLHEAVADGVLGGVARRVHGVVANVKVCVNARGGASGENAHARARREPCGWKREACTRVPRSSMPLAPACPIRSLTAMADGARFAGVEKWEGGRQQEDGLAAAGK